MTDNVWEDLLTELQAKDDLEAVVPLAAKAYMFYDSLVKFGMEIEIALELTKYYLSALMM